VLVFTLPEEAAVARLVKRGETSGRADDNEDTIRSRMRVFAEESQPVIDALKATGRVTEVDSQGDVDEVFALLVPALQALQDIGVSESSKRLELSV
jgi:adenylate kinase/UMP-CMP kinase